VTVRSRTGPWEAAVRLGARVSFALIACTLAVSMPATVQGAASPALDEGQVKAAFLFNFAKFVQWPSSERGPLVIGVVGDDALGELVQKVVQGRSVNGRDLTTRRLTIEDDPAGCNVLFIPGTRPRDAAELLQRARGAILTVGETPQFVRDGGMVRFFVEDNHVRFQINQKNAEAAGLKISSQLLTLAAR
jgi:hypothetical protein